MGEYFIKKSKNQDQKNQEKTKKEAAPPEEGAEREPKQMHGPQEEKNGGLFTPFPSPPRRRHGH